MNENEKLGPNPINRTRMLKFCNLVKQCGFIDLGYSGAAYTWTNKRFNSYPTFERLDRCLGNADWCASFPGTTIYHMPMMHSDHAPILTLLHSSRPKLRKPFRFENWWLLEHDFTHIAKSSWIKSTNRPFHLKTTFPANDLKIWRTKIPNSKQQL
ncbi:hypothetical protein BS78_K253600 [Paspalum vaginatum]|uniref:Endonuclease/exonuclease/phosphatase domain-containing protein n=1 Tax=Paspalum vaginatum TaxID=158149 RepID=A0A9W7X6Y4_9POAL|nr:hypothetical protein BS78_K253600 [Paspalum vaginatum]